VVVDVVVCVYRLESSERSFDGQPWRLGRMMYDLFVAVGDRERASRKYVRIILD
jgi:hypothetical protein